MIEVYTKDGKQEFDNNTSKDYYAAMQKAYRKEGPAIISYFNNRKVKCKIWLINGKRHREDGPAIIWYYKNGNKERENWYINGKYHRENGPAYISYLKNGKIISKQYWLNDKKYTFINWKKKINI